jgi:hypothetical protein
MCRVLYRQVNPDKDTIPGYAVLPDEPGIVAMDDEVPIPTVMSDEKLWE